MECMSVDSDNHEEGDIANGERRDIFCGNGLNEPHNRSTAQEQSRCGESYKWPQSTLVKLWTVNRD